MGGEKRFPTLGLLAALSFIVALSVFLLTGRVAFFTDKIHSKFTPVASSFLTELQELDVQFVSFSPSDTVVISRKIDALEKKALGVESELSLLKRRRELLRLAQKHGIATKDLNNAYLESVKRAASHFPHAEALAALASEAYLASGQKALAESYAVQLSEDRFIPISAAVLLSQMPVSETILLKASTIYADAGMKETAASLRIDTALLRLLSHDSMSALSSLRTWSLNEDFDSERARILLAELECDFGNLKISADLFSAMNSNAFIFRRSDALYQAGSIAPAREAWMDLLEYSDSPDMQGKALYNLAATDSSTQDALSHLGRALEIDPSAVYPALRLARLLDSFEKPDKLRVTAILSTALKGTDRALVELELLRSSLGSKEARASLAEVWVLLEKYPEDTRIQRWAAYFMEQDLFRDELDKLLQSGNPALDFHRSLSLLRLGHLDEAERILFRLAGTDGDWRIAANLGLIAEARRKIAPALELYETATALDMSSTSKAELQLRIARCLVALGREADARRALEYGLDLDPQNRMLRLALRRLSQ